MKKVIGLLVMLVCFTGCASNGGVDYEDPSTFQEQNFASYEEWVDAELDLAQYYGGFTDEQLAYFREVAMQMKHCSEKNFVVLMKRLKCICSNKI